MPERPPPPAPHDQTRLDGFDVIFATVSLLGQTLLYGAFAAFTPYAIWTILNRRKDRKIAKLAFYLNVLMFLLSTTYWTICIATLIQKLKAYFVDQLPVPERPLHVGLIKKMSNAVVLVNVLFSDGIVLWRANVICRNLRIAIYVSTFFFFLTTLGIFATIGLRISATVVEANLGFEDKQNKLNRAISISQLAYQLFSLLANLTATGAIGWKLKHYTNTLRVFDQSAARPNPTIKNAFALLIESGVIYCISTTFLFIAQFIRLPFGTLGDIYSPIHAQIAGLYPSAVLVLVYQRDRLLSEAKSSRVTAISVQLEQRSSDKRDRPPKLETMNFAPATGSFSESILSSPRIDTYGVGRTGFQRTARKQDQDAIDPIPNSVH